MDPGAQPRDAQELDGIGALITLGFSPVRMYQQESVSPATSASLSPDLSGNPGAKPSSTARTQRSKGKQQPGNTLPLGTCWNFARTGKCKFGDACRYKHTEVQARGKAGTSNSSIPKEPGHGGTKSEPHVPSGKTPGRRQKTAGQAAGSSRGQAAKSVSGNGAASDSRQDHNHDTGASALVSAIQELTTSATTTKGTPSSSVAAAISKPPQEIKDVTQTMCEGTVSATFGAGYIVTELTPISSTTCSIHLRNLPPNITLEEICRLIHDTISQYIAPYHVRLEAGETSTEATIRLSTAADAEKAVKALSGHELHGHCLVANLLESASDVTDRSSISCSWFLPSRFAFMSFSSQEAVDDAAKAIESVKLCSRHKKLPPKPFQGSMRYGIHLFGLSVDMTRAKLEELLPGSVFMDLKEPRYDMPLYEVMAMIQSIFEQNPDTPVEFNVLSKPEDQRQRAVASFSNAVIAERIFADLESKPHSFLGGQTLFPKIQHTTKLRIGYDIYRSIVSEIRQIVSSDPSLTSRVWEKEQRPVWLTLTSPTRSSLTQAKSRIRSLLRGSPVCGENGLRLWDPKLTHPSARTALRTAAAEQNIYLHIDARTRTVLLYGSPDAKTAAAPALLAEYRALLTRRLKPTTFRFPAQTTITERTTILDTINHQHPSRLITSTESTFTVNLDPRAIPAIHKLLLTRSTESSDCVICFCEADTPLTTPCAHVYCTTCLHRSAEHASSTRTPLLCDAQDCGTPFPITFITSHLPAQLLEDLQIAAVEAYIQSHLAEIFFCPTPDCAGVLPSQGSRACSVCLLTACRECKTTSHEGVTCAENRMTDDERLGVWTREKGVKKCPGAGCGALIEKNEGCDHMMCASCKVHFCWRCGRVLEERVVYGHVAECQGMEWGGADGGGGQEGGRQELRGVVEEEVLRERREMEREMQRRQRVTEMMQGVGRLHREEFERERRLRQAERQREEDERRERERRGGGAWCCIM